MKPNPDFPVILARANRVAMRNELSDTFCALQIAQKFTQFSASKRLFWFAPDIVFLASVFLFTPRACIVHAEEPGCR